MRAIPFALLLIAVPAAAQDAGRALESSAEEKAPTPHEILGAALMKHRRGGDIVVAVNVEHKQPEADPPAGGGRQGNIVQVVVQGPGSPRGEPFEGDVEAWRDAGGNTVLVSAKKLPGFGLFVTPERTLRRVTAEGAAPDINQLRTEILSFLESDRFAKHVANAELRHSVDPETGEHVWGGEVDKNIVRPVRAEGVDPHIAAAVGGLAPRVLRASLVLRVSKNGEIRSAKVTIVRNDPGREMLRGGFGGGIVIQGGQLRKQPEKQPDGDAKHDIEGVSTIYTLDFTKKSPSERAKSFKREMTRLAE